MCRRSTINQETEIGVDCHEDALFAHCNLQQCRIARVIRLDAPHVMTLLAEPLCDTAPGAAIDEKFQIGTFTASIRSLATTAWA